MEENVSGCFFWAQCIVELAEQLRYIYYACENFLPLFYILPPPAAGLGPSCELQASGVITQKRTQYIARESSFTRTLIRIV